MFDGLSWVCTTETGAWISDINGRPRDLLDGYSVLLEGKIALYSGACALVP